AGRRGEVRLGAAVINGRAHAGRPAVGGDADAVVGGGWREDGGVRHIIVHAIADAAHEHRAIARRVIIVGRVGGDLVAFRSDEALVDHAGGKWRLAGDGRVKI